MVLDVSAVAIFTCNRTGGSVGMRRILPGYGFILVAFGAWGRVGQNNGG
jgi:hypothetical protein